jgi:hypothetical protein
MKKIYVVTLILSFLLVLPVKRVLAGDLDDGISKFTDDGISKYDDLGKTDKNIKFIVMNAMSKANAMKKGKDDPDTYKKKGDANMNSVVLGVGSRVSGDIIIIDKSKGPKTNVAAGN